ncbi:hypothetical protein RN001_013441 [Aquatica leii]|uniref:Uncharacterized protein n=1 Tax=Aquatica leii TaxID=1421715 RepID=A0AAN7S719_9COLE|nr:hypothetical protein RN001_013441 [Aquatica leii]
MIRISYSVILLVLAEPPAYNINNDCPIKNKTPTKAFNELNAFLTPLQVSIIFAAYELGASLTLIFTETMGNRFGYTMCIGIEMLCSAILGMLTPIAVVLKNFYALVVIRLLTGALLSPIYPMMNVLMSNWSPTNERNTYGIILYGSSVGTFTTIIIYGRIILNLKHITTYLTGMIIIIWCMVWMLFVTDHPSMHSRVTLQELDEISRQRMSIDTLRIRRRTPWKEIVRSSKIRALALLMWCNTWNLTFFMDYMPMYYNQMTSKTFTEAIDWACLPLFSRLVGSIVCLPIIKCLLITNMLSITVMRKIFTVFSHIIPGTIALATLTTNCIEIANVIKMIVIMGFNGAFVGGGFINAIDLTPNFARNIFAPMLSLITLSGVIMPFVVGCVLQHYNQHVIAWSIIMGVCGGVYLLGGIIYIIFGSASIQSWDIAYARQAFQSVSRIYFDDEDFDF